MWLPFSPRSEVVGLSLRWLRARINLNIPRQQPSLSRCIICCFANATWMTGMASGREINILLRKDLTHSRFTALLEFVRDYLGEQVPER